jgi:hypothetical protein
VTSTLGRELVSTQSPTRGDNHVKRFQQPVDRVGEIPHLVAGSAEASHSWTLPAEIRLMAVFTVRSGLQHPPSHQPAEHE